MKPRLVSRVFPPVSRSVCRDGGLNGFLIAACLMLFVVSACSIGRAQKTTDSAAPKGVQTIRGRLVTGLKWPTLRAGGMEYILHGQSAYLLRVLEDKRLANQELQLEGTRGADGAFVVSRIYALRNGELYKIQYYCNVCNITYVQPGHCYCCGRETALQEVPVGPAR